MRISILALFVHVSQILAIFRDPPGWEHGGDLEQFVTRPEIKAPRYQVAKHHPEAIRPGYWFVTPYSSFQGQAPSTRLEHIPCQTGPHIYDGDGSLVWSGACKFANRNSFGLTPVSVDGEQHLSVYVSADKSSTDVPEEDQSDAGVLLNNRYEEVSRYAPLGDKWGDVHVFKILADGKSTLLSTIWQTTWNATELGQGERFVWANGFQEIDSATGELLFEWDALSNNVLLNESCNLLDRADSSSPLPFDYLHINSVDKNADGDYLVSARHTSTIYKVSGEDGSVIWRLGGYQSDFELGPDANFSWQHHAVFRRENETHTVISFFDNGGEESNRNPDMRQSRSAGKIVALNTASTPMTAEVLRQFDRPDGENSPLQGSLQQIGDDDIEDAQIFIDWAISGYISEYDSMNRLVFEAKFLSDRMRSYRAYKYPFVGRPTEDPTFKILPIKLSDNQLASALYVSWNGATEVKSWAFYGSNTENGTFEPLGNTLKRGFETSLIIPSIVNYAYAEGSNGENEVLGRSVVVSINSNSQGQYLTATQQLLEDVRSDKASTEHDWAFWRSMPVRMSGSSVGAADLQIFTALLSLTVVSLASYGLYSILRAFQLRIKRRRVSHMPLSIRFNSR